MGTGTDRVLERVMLLVLRQLDVEHAHNEPGLQQILAFNEQVPIWSILEMNIHANLVRMNLFTKP